MDYYKVVARVTKGKVGHLYTIMVKTDDVSEAMTKTVEHLTREFDSHVIEDTLKIRFDKEL